MSILISGSLAYDHVMNFPDSFKNHIMPDQIHILNVAFMIDRLNKGWGGTAGNIAYTVKLLEGEPIMLSAVGKDGEEYLKHFEKNKINTDFIIRDNNQFTSSAHITTDMDDNQITAFYNGPLELGLDINVSDVLEKIEKPKVVLISPTQKEVMIKHLKEAWELGLTTVFDPGQQITAFKETELRQMVGQAKIVIGNDYEMKLLLERTGWSAKELLQNCEMVITTLGQKGSVIMTDKGEQIEVCVAKPYSVDDPTGAGDAYRAGFFTAYTQGKSLKECGETGAVAGSFAVENYGTQEHKFTKEEFENRYSENFK